MDHGETKATSCEHEREILGHDWAGQGEGKFLWDVQLIPTKKAGVRLMFERKEKPSWRRKKITNLFCVTRKKAVLARFRGFTDMLLMQVTGETLGRNR